MTFLKNIADSPRGVMTASGLVMIDAGAVESVELTPRERASLGSFFKVVAAPKVEPTAPKRTRRKAVVDAEPIDSPADDEADD